jgi:hypothetical protein
MYKVRTYSPTPTITYNAGANLRLLQFDADVLADTLTPVAGLRIVRAGSVLARDAKLIKRAKLLTAVALAETEIYVNNPWAFAVGDALRVIAAPRTEAATELAAITGATGASLGTITAIELGANTQTSRITLTTAVVGNIVSIDFNGVSIVYTIASTVIADEIAGLAKAILARLALVDQYRYVEANVFPTYVELKSTQLNQILEFEVLLSQGTGGSLGAITTSTDLGLGKITLSAGVGAAIAQGTKIGVVTQRALGIFDSEFDFSDYPQGVSNASAVCPLYGGQFYADGMPYLDGQIMADLPQAQWIPAIA